MERLQRSGGREQEQAIVDMVLENHLITLKQLKVRVRIIADNNVFRDIATISVASVDRVLRRNSVRMKQVYRVPFDRNTPRVKQLRREYVQVSSILGIDVLLYSIAPYCKGTMWSLLAAFSG